MSAHTPGPWLFDEDQPREADGSLRYFPHVFIGPPMRYSDDSGAWRAKILVNEGPTPEDARQGFGHGTTMETAEANARLIAAAPDLYEEAVRLLAGKDLSADVADNESYFVTARELRALAAAIAKAVGK